MLTFQIPPNRVIFSLLLLAVQIGLMQLQAELQAHRTIVCGGLRLAAGAYTVNEVVDLRLERFENKSTAEDFFFRVFLNRFAVSDNVLLHIRLNLRRRNMTVLRNSLIWSLRTAPTD